MVNKQKYIDSHYYSDDYGRNIMYYEDAMEAIKIAEADQKKIMKQKLIEVMKGVDIFKADFIHKVVSDLCKKMEE